MYIITLTDNDKFVTRHVDGKIGHHLSYAQKLAKEMNEARAALREVRRLFGNDWPAELKRFGELVKEL